MPEVTAVQVKEARDKLLGFPKRLRQVVPRAIEVMKAPSKHSISELLEIDQELGKLDEDAQWFQDSLEGPLREVLEFGNAAGGIRPLDLAHPDDEEGIKHFSQFTTFFEIALWQGCPIRYYHETFRWIMEDVFIQHGCELNEEESHVDFLDVAPAERAPGPFEFNGYKQTAREFDRWAPRIREECARAIDWLEKHRSGSSPGEIPPDCWHSDDFSVVVWRGKEFDLSKKRRIIARTLWEALAHGKPDVAWSTLKQKAGIMGRSRFRDSFKTLPDWRELVEQGSKRGTWRLKTSE